MKNQGYKRSIWRVDGITVGQKAVNIINRLQYSVQFNFQCKLSLALVTVDEDVIKTWCLRIDTD